jgi:hypothetical protein
MDPSEQSSPLTDFLRRTERLRTVAASECKTLAATVRPRRSSSVNQTLGQAARAANGQQTSEIGFAQPCGKGSREARKAA